MQTGSGCDRNEPVAATSPTVIPIYLPIPLPDSKHTPYDNKMQLQCWSWYMSKTDLVLILFLHNCGPYPVPTNVCDAAILLEHLLHAVNAVSANSLDNCQVFYWTKSMENQERKIMPGRGHKTSTSLSLIPFPVLPCPPHHHCTSSSRT